MLKRKDLPWRERNREALRLRNIFFTTTIERMSAENILLDEAQDTDAESFHAALAERTGLRFSFPRERIEGTFMREGRFVSFDKRRAAEVLFSHTTDVWLYDDPNYTAYKKWYFDNIFCKISTVSADDEARARVPAYGGDFPDWGRVRAYDVLRGILDGSLEEGDNVLYLLCPLIDCAKQDYKITTAFYRPFFRCLVEREGDNIILRNADPRSAAFILAFAEALPFETAAHKREILARIAAILRKKGFAIPSLQDSRLP